MKRAIIRVTVVAILSLIFATAGCASFSKTAPDPGEPTNISALQPAHPSQLEGIRYDTAAFALVADMEAGWNLGNALDSLDHQKAGIYTQLQMQTPEEYYETFWGNPVTTPKVISDVAKIGFGAVRIPVTWQDHMNDDNEISRSWLDRVKQIVDDVLNNDMYCIINLHHDTGSGTWPWLNADPSMLDENKEILCKVWNQIAVFFQDYNELLLFESFNEILDAQDRWTGSTPESYEAVNQLNQAFVDTVRATGGMNSNRFLVVNPYAASVNSEILRSFRLPVDTVDNRLIVGVHTYAPAGFTWRQDMATWTETFSAWDEESAITEVSAMLQPLYDNMVKKGIPVIISECGAWNKNNTSDRCAYAAFLVREAAKYNITCFWWDEGGKHSSLESVNNTALYDRYNERWLFPEVAAAFINRVDGDSASEREP